MIGRDAIFNDLEALEGRFGDAAKDAWIPLGVKHREMSMALNQMLLIVRREFIKNPSLGGELIDFVLDFLERGDMIPSFLEQGFKNAGSLERQAIDMQIADALAYLKPKSFDLNTTWTLE